MARFSRAQRLLRPEEYRRVFEQGAKTGDEAILILGVCNDLAYPRLGLAIAKKHLKQAVQRNRVKRLIRESFRGHLDALAGLDLVVLSRNGITTKTNREIFTALERHWTKIQNRCSSSSSS